MLLGQLIQALRGMPSIGFKSAQRIAYYLLEQDRETAENLSATLQQALNTINYCELCRNLTEDKICSICSNSSRNTDKLCIVETSMDVRSIENIGEYRGKYFILHGRLSPMDGIGPKNLGIDKLESILNNGEIIEIIIATNSTVEGEVTANYIANLLKTKEHLNITRPAHGVPIGSEIEYLDPRTLSLAFNNRKNI